tara:strand:+ start:1011 stop:1793 length:783 start_codon:yes stop_codon:yes gene_type:complete
MIIDSHCHLEYDPLFNDLDNVIERANNKGVKYLLSISTTDDSFNKIINIIKKYSCIFGTYGIHPHETKNYANITKDIILAKINYDKKIIGIGETGLDFYYNHSDRKIQKKIFIEHIHAAQISGLPLIVHSRSAENDTFEILKSEFSNKNFKILLHCFTGSKDFAHKLLDINSYISASGVITFKNSKDLANTFKSIPLDKILVETDSPYLSPMPLRGKSNEPSHIIHTVKFLSDLKSTKLEEVANITTQNFINLFGKLNEK